MKLRHQLAAYSPLTSRAICDAGLASAGLLNGAATTLRNHLLEFYGAEECVLVGSGTQALQYAIRIAVADAGAKPFVALPAFTCYDVASAAIGAGVCVALYDVDPLTLAPDLDSLGAVLAAGASVAVMAPLYGIPVDWDAISALGSRYGVPLIEDAAQGHGATWGATPLGALGTISTISFGRGKGWTGGAGGAVLMRANRGTASFETAPVGSALNLQVVAGLAAQWALGRPQLYGVPRAIPALALGETVYHAPSAVTNMPSAAAAAAVRNESASRREAEGRRRNAAALIAALGDSRALSIRVPAGGVPGYIRLPLLVANGFGGLPTNAGRLGVGQSYPTTLARLPQLNERLVTVNGAWPGADRLARELITFPTHSRVNAAERNALIGLVAR